ncbi:prepilin-type N-terminal cleavage/methylation domain-containing protein, partial [Fibrobacterales bacterium]|nr:prepilin-type N-terminal cleavage/methylation domain-containing protein [Fibrobacterales bacterium]
MSKKTNKNLGMTLVELLIYMIISSIGVVLATQVWLDVFKSGIQTKGLLDISSDQGDVILYLEKDLMKMGNAWTKRADSTMVLDSSVMTNPNGVGNLRDLSAFEETEGTSYDALTIKGVIEDESGIYAGYDSINWYVDASKSTLYRSRVTIDSSGTKGTPLVDIVASGVNRFKLEFGVHGEDTAGGLLVLGDYETMDYTMKTDTIDAGDSVMYSEYPDSLDLVIIDSAAGRSYEMDIVIRPTQDLVDTWNILDDTLQLRMTPTADTTKRLDGTHAFNMYPTNVAGNTFTWSFSVGKDVVPGNYKPLIRLIKASTKNIGQ